MECISELFEVKGISVVYQEFHRLNLQLFRFTELAHLVENHHLILLCLCTFVGMVHCEPLVLKALLRGNTLRWVLLKHFSQQVFRRI